MEAVSRLLSPRLLRRCPKLTPTCRGGAGAFACQVSTPHVLGPALSPANVHGSIPNFLGTPYGESRNFVRYGKERMSLNHTRRSHVGRPAVRASALALLLSGALLAQQLNLKPYGLEQGLLNLVVQSLLQDRTGFLWVGTQSGFAVWSRASKSQRSFDAVSR